jgi:GntR family transcriptional regulator/MocR family aminotransferase
MTKPLSLDLDRSARIPLGEQIRSGIAAAIESGVLAPGARLPSWQDLAAQLGVARGTVRVAYEKLVAAQLVTASRSAGTRVAERPRAAIRPEQPPDAGSFMEMYLEMNQGPAIFQMGVPSADTFPATLVARVQAQAVRAEATGPQVYPDPRGELELRQEIAGYLAVARGIECSPSQIIVTGGFASGLGVALRALGLEGETAWMEEPGFPFTRHGLELARLRIEPILVDADGIDVECGLRQCPEAKLAVVTPGQQAPLGGTLSLERRLRLLEWAASEGAWIVEDDYLSELQLKGRAAPALASLDRDGRVIHIGSFSKTISPTLRLGYMVAPSQCLSLFAEVAACLFAPPSPSLQLAIAEFMREGHYLRHLRRTKRAYASRREALLQALKPHFDHAHVGSAGLAVTLRLPDGCDDLAIARECLPFGLAPAPLSSWYARAEFARQGLLLGVATSPEKQVLRAADRLHSVVRRFA